MSPVVRGQQQQALLGNREGHIVVNPAYFPENHSSIDTTVKYPSRNMFSLWFAQTD